MAPPHPPTTRIFVSHSRTDDAFTVRLVADLQAAGADVWVDTTSIMSDDFVQRINEGLADREWFVLVMSPRALRSAWVNMEVNAAILLCRQERMRTIIPIIAENCDEREIPPLWALYQRYDATQDYDQAMRNMLAVMGLTTPGKGAPVPPFTQEEEVYYGSLMAYPSLDNLRTLQIHEFQRLCAYVFTKAGYAVRIPAADQIPHCDLRLEVGSGTAALPESYVLFRSETTALVTGVEVRAVREAMESSRSIPFYVITRSAFEPRAYSEIAAVPHLRLFDGMHLIRYFTYVYLTGGRQEQPAQHPISLDVLFAAGRIRRRPQDQTKVLALVHNKGGVGSTTTAFGLARELARRGQTTLLVDMDEQGNLSHPLQDPHATRAQQLNIADYFQGRCSLSDLVTPTVNEHIWLIPGHPGLAPLQNYLPSSPNTELQFTTELHDESLRPRGKLVDAKFDWIIFDTSPALTLYVHSAMVAAHYVLALTPATAFGGASLNDVLTTLRLTKALTGPHFRKFGCLLTMWNDTVASRKLVDSLTGTLQREGMRILRTRIPHDIHRLPHVYAMLVDELLEDFKSD